jgi:GH24 family phage-related lysozyme (muramidase)
MSDFRRAINLIKKYEGYSEKAYPDISTGDMPYTIGYGTQFYPDGSPVKKGHLCTQRKAEEYLLHEVNVIYDELFKLNLGLDESMTNALISFIHSVGWEPFLYSSIIDCIEVEDWSGVCEEMNRWIFDSYYKVIGGLLDRRKEEVGLFLNDLKTTLELPGAILLTAFTTYTGAPYQREAIKSLEQKLNPYVLAEFANAFDFEHYKEDMSLYGYSEEDSLVSSWD